MWNKLENSPCMIGLKGIGLASSLGARLDTHGCQSHRTKLPYFRNELVEKSVNGQNWQTGQSYFLAIYVYKNLKSSLQMMEFI